MASSNRLSDSLAQALNAQITKEALAAQIYISYAAWAADKGYAGVHNFLMRHAHEERDHMAKFIQYIIDRGGRVRIEGIPAPPADPQSLNDCFNKVLDHEVDNTKAVYNLANLAFEEKDWATWNFIQWFVREQVEEEKLSLALIDKMRIAGGESADNESIHRIDSELEHSKGEVSSAIHAHE